MPTTVPAPKKITPAIAAQLMQRRREGASTRALGREFPFSNQATGKFFKKEDAKPTAEPQRASQQPREAAKARRGGKRTSQDPAGSPERKPNPADGGPLPAEHQPPRRLFYSSDVPEFASAEERLAYYETHRLDDPPYSIWDSNDARRGAPTAAERNHRRRR